MQRPDRQFLKPILRAISPQVRIQFAMQQSLGNQIRQEAQSVPKSLLPRLKANLTQLAGQLTASVPAEVPIVSITFTVQHRKGWHEDDELTSRDQAIPDLSELDRKSTRLNSSHVSESRMPSSA